MKKFLAAVLVLAVVTAGCSHDSGISDEVTTGLKKEQRVDPAEFEADDIIWFDLEYRDEETADLTEDISIEMYPGDTTAVINKEEYTLSEDQCSKLREFILEYSKTVKEKKDEYWPQTEEYPAMLILFKFEIRGEDKRYKETGALCYPDGLEGFIENLKEMIIEPEENTAVSAAAKDDNADKPETEPEKETENETDTEAESLTEPAAVSETVPYIPNSKFIESAESMDIGEMMKLIEENSKTVGNDSAGYITVYFGEKYEEYEDGSFTVTSEDGKTRIFTELYSDLRTDLEQTAYMFCLTAAMNSEIDGYETYNINDVTVDGMNGAFAVMIDSDSDLGFKLYAAFADTESGMIRALGCECSDFTEEGLIASSLVFDSYRRSDGTE